ncbi:amidohydrolase [Kocuria dechangensis]|uniref:Amidohydrolase n=1 Tax=Kocuria dechangensis TaxID=1176249 RepID=A0A917H6I4_9MICC|nr:amidohydrolase [Kocuria dechangensis]GGG69148.1 amidohydrolase [Kocuria dechangensis]
MDPHIITGGTIRTTAGSAPVEALGIADGRIVAAGSLKEVTAALPEAEVIDTAGGTIVPGLVESHVHPIFFGLTQHWVDCRSPLNSSVSDIVARLRERLESSNDPTGWIRGWGYDDTLLAENRHPTRDELDKASPEAPIVISHISGHFLVANTKALELAGVSPDTPDPSEGRFIKDPKGRPTGLMWEIGAVNRVLDCIPRPTATELADAAKFAAETAMRRGMTTIHDLGIGLMAGYAELKTWEHLASQGELPLRVEGYLRGDLIEEFIAEHPQGFPYTVGNFTLRGAKYWSDGSIQGLSAALSQPYSCAEESCGELLFTHDQLVELITRVDQLGGQCAVHANGDLAISTVIGALQTVRDSGGRPDARHRVEHLQMASAQDIDDLVRAGGVASVFANHVYYWGDRHRDVFLGPERANRMEPLAEAARAGLHFGLHSDCPITPMDPLRTLWTATSRRTSTGEILGETQKLTPAQALHSLTADSAWLVHEEHRRGTLEPGMAADFAILDRDILTASEDELAHIDVLATVVAGQWVFSEPMSLPAATAHAGERV